MCNGSARVAGKPHIVDRAGRGQLPVGIESFEDVLRQFVYVDKTLAVKELIDRQGVTLYCRPRRFGKSTFLRMLQCFFEMPADGIRGREELFEGLAIAESDPRYMAECGAHPVIYLNLAGCGGTSFEETGSHIGRMVGREYVRHAYLARSQSLMSFERRRFERIAAGEATASELAGSLADLSGFLARHHQAQVVILIDEYDTPVNDAHVHGFREDVLGFYRAWLSDALKGTTDLYCAALTGVLRVSQESIFSELNNVQMDTTLDDDHAEAIGFTEAEAEALAAYTGRADRVAEMRAWYDGYSFGRTKAYNPWSVLNFLRKNEAQPYWTNTSRNGIVTELIAQAGDDQTVELAMLASGGVVKKPLDLRTVFDDLTHNPEAVWPQLYQSGYVTTEDTGFPNDSRRLRHLKVPNLEVRELFTSELGKRSLRTACPRA